MDTIEKQLTQVFHEVFLDDQIQLKPSLSAADLEDWDSLSNIHLITAVEKKFSIRFETGEVASLENVGQMIQMIQEKLKPDN